MRLQTIVTVFALTLPSLASVLNLNIYTDSATGKKSVGKAKATEDQKAIVIVEDSKPPRWRRRDSNHLIPLVPGAKTGALPIAYEEGLTSALGPRFANVFIEAAVGHQNGSNIEASCNFIGCAGTVIKAAPCIAAAIACKCAAPILSCPVSIRDICSCVACLPDAIEKFIDQIGICSGNFKDVPALPAADDDDGSDYPEFIAYSTRSSNLLAYRGDLPLSTLSEAKAVAATGLCPGAPCGSCKCCLGVCVPFAEQCLGVCLPIPGDSSNHQEL